MSSNSKLTQQQQTKQIKMLVDTAGHISTYLHRTGNSMYKITIYTSHTNIHVYSVIGRSQVCNISMIALTNVKQNESRPGLGEHRWISATKYMTIHVWTQLSNKQRYCICHVISTTKACIAANLVLV